MPAAPAIAPLLGTIAVKTTSAPALSAIGEGFGQVLRSVWGAASGGGAAPAPADGGQGRPAPADPDPEAATTAEAAVDQAASCRRFRRACRWRPWQLWPASRRIRRRTAATPPRGPWRIGKPIRRRRRPVPSSCRRRKPSCVQPGHGPARGDSPAWRVARGRPQLSGQPAQTRRPPRPPPRRARGRPPKAPRRPGRCCRRGSGHRGDATARRRAQPGHAPAQVAAAANGLDTAEIPTPCRPEPPRPPRGRRSEGDHLKRLRPPRPPRQGRSRSRGPSPSKHPPIRLGPSPNPSMRRRILRRRRCRAAWRGRGGATQTRTRLRFNLMKSPFRPVNRHPPPLPRACHRNPNAWLPCHPINRPPCRRRCRPWPPASLGRRRPPPPRTGKSRFARSRPPIRPIPPRRPMHCRSRWCPSARRPPHLPRLRSP